MARLWLGVCACVKALMGDREEGVGDQSSGTETVFQPKAWRILLYLTAYQQWVSWEEVVRECNVEWNDSGLLPWSVGIKRAHGWGSSIPLMHWVAFTSLFSAPLSICAALKPQSDAFNKGPVVFIQKFRNSYRTSGQGTWLPQLSTVSPWIQKGIKSLAICFLEVYNYFLGVGATEDQVIVLTSLSQMCHRLRMSSLFTTFWGMIFVDVLLLISLIWNLKKNFMSPEFRLLFSYNVWICSIHRWLTDKYETMTGF